MGAQRQRDARVSDLDHGLTSYNMKEIADSDVVAALDGDFSIDVADGAGTRNIDIVPKHKVRVFDAIVTKQAGAGGASDTLQLRNGTTNAITNAMSINVADNTVVRAGTVDDAYQDVDPAAGGFIRVQVVKASAANVACRVMIRVVRV